MNASTSTRCAFLPNYIIRTSCNCSSWLRRTTSSTLFFSISTGMFTSCSRRREDCHIRKSGMSPIKPYKPSLTCIARASFTGTWSLKICWRWMEPSSWLILDWPGRSELSLHLLSMWQRDGTERLRPCLEAETTTRPWTCSLSAQSWRNCTAALRFSLDPLRRTNWCASCRRWEHQQKKNGLRDTS